MSTRHRSAVAAVTLAVTLLAALMSPMFVAPLKAAQSPQTLNIGVIGSFSGPTAQGVSLAVERLTARGPIAGPGGAVFNPAVIAIDAKTSGEVAKAVAELLRNNAVAIFGPDDDTLAAQSVSALANAGVPVFSGATSTAFRAGGFIFRTRAASNRMAAGLAEVLITDLNRNNFAVFQGNSNVGPQVSEMVGALTQKGKPPAPPVIQVAGGAVSDSARVLMNSQPDAIVAFGDAAQLAELYRTLRGLNFPGTFATPLSDDRLFMRAIPEPLRSGIYGVTNWPYSWNVADSSAFTRDYVATFGEVPTGLSAAAYDAAVALLISVRDAGVAPDPLRAKILSLPKADSIQGAFNSKLGTGELSANVAVIVTGRYGAPVLVARFDETGRLKLLEVPPTGTPRPPTLVPAPTNTIEGVVGTVKSNVNVRTGPGTVYPVLGQLRKGDQVQLVGVSADLAWYVITFKGRPGWVSASFLDVVGDIRTLPIIAAPPTPVPTPTPVASLTPTAQPLADIVLVNATLNPAIPQPGVPFTLTATIRNQGSVPAGEFAVATSFKPGEVYVAAVVPGLAPGQETTVNLTATVNGTGIFTIAIVLDLNNQVNEGPNGEANNKPEFTYKVDRPHVAQGTQNIPPGGSFDFFGGTQDVSFSGTQLTPINGAKLGILSGVQMGQIYWDLLTPDKINNNVGIPQAQLTVGTVIGMYTAEGKRGALRVANYVGASVVLEYFVYDQ
jgi:ABC-type branched-subunit amino acid transport system substrate-binding protein